MTGEDEITEQANQQRDTPQRQPAHPNLTPGVILGLDPRTHHRPNRRDVNGCTEQVHCCPV
ncbi:hypothetical protein QE369_003486 [Agrobacterium larrymoorei]|uniref:Uncharacterized protein n=1 Tax=Agrobacterium larrymoorei TaxID=160699 RepID=A0AAJ2BD05_9HYPH|nr:hypothetical protein [Agrobacterium larrymoorei]